MCFSIKEIARIHLLLVKKKKCHKQRLCRVVTLSHSLIWSPKCKGTGFFSLKAFLGYWVRVFFQVHRRALTCGVVEENREEEKEVTVLGYVGAVCVLGMFE